MICLVGKSCTGKDTILKEMLSGFNYKPVVTYTTRPPRPGEVDGVDYHFIDKSQFRRMKIQGFFAETTSYNVATGETWYYGTRLKDLNDDSIIILNPEGLRTLKENKDLNIVSFLITAKEETLRERLKKRGDNPEEAERRLEADRNDFKDINDLIDFSLSNDLGIDVANIANLIHIIYSHTDTGMSYRRKCFENN